MLIVGVVLLVAGFVWQMFPTPDITIDDFPLGAYIVGSISGIGLCLIGFSIVYNFMSKKYQDS
jgi:hypothetical protein